MTPMADPSLLDDREPPRGPGEACPCNDEQGASVDTGPEARLRPGDAPTGDAKAANR